jgi:predicted  nucleic acid-binding Zn-ribbon protein
LKDQLRLLLQLQAIDTRVQELEATIAQLPKPLESDKLSLTRLETMLADEKARLTETERWRNKRG